MCGLATAETGQTAKDEEQICKKNSVGELSEFGYFVVVVAAAAAAAAAAVLLLLLLIGTGGGLLWMR
jgi:hypothetical protein